MSVRDIMTIKPVCCTPEAKLEAVARLMVEHDCGEIPVCDAGKLIGVVTDRDILVRTIAKGRDPLGVAVRQVMTRKVYTVRASDSVERALSIMERRQVRRLPVVDSRGKLVGIISQADIAEILPEQKAGELLFEISHPAGKAPKRVML
jgi:CBS domain-containing protein